MNGKVFIVALLVLGLVGLAFAAKPVQRAQGPPVTVSEDDNGAPAMTHAPQGLRERIAQRIKLPEEFVQRALQRRAEVARGVQIGTEQIRKWAMVSRKYANFVQRIRKIAAQYRLRLREWRRAKKLYEEGNISEEDYFDKAKEFVLAAIDAAIERLQALKENNVVADEAVGIDEAIGRLEDLRARVESAEDLNTLRNLYREEVLPALREYHNRKFFRLYLWGAIRAVQSIVVRLDVAAIRLARYVDRAKELGIYDEEMDAEVTAIFAEIEGIKEELSALEEEVTQKEISPREYIVKLNKIKEDVWRIYREIVDLMREYARKHAEVSARGG